MVGQQLGVLPDAEDVRDVQQRRAGVLVGALGLSNVGLVFSDFGDCARRLASG